MMTQEDKTISSVQCRCGEIAVRGEGLRRNEMFCKDCGAAWEITNCWNCSGVIDSRESDHCSECHWYICHDCGSHEQDCTETMRGFPFRFGFGKAF